MSFSDQYLMGVYVESIWHKGRNVIVYKVLYLGKGKKEEDRSAQSQGRRATKLTLLEFGLPWDAALPGHAALPEFSPISSPPKFVGFLKGGHSRTGLRRPRT